MSLPLPNLDDRRWPDLVESGRALIPRDAPRWTDHNVHDPGITLLELFAWLSESTVYRLNQVPARHRLKFLKLIGYSLAPPRASRTVLVFTPDSGTSPFELPAGVVFETSAAKGTSVTPGSSAITETPVPFRSLRPLWVADMRLAAILVDAEDGMPADRTGDFRDGFRVAALGRDPRPGAALYLGFPTMPTQIPVALAFRFAGSGNGREDRKRIEDEEREQYEACRPFAPDIPCPGVDPAAPETGAPLKHHSAQLAWEAFTGAGAAPWLSLQPVGSAARPSVGQVRDDTRSLTLDGVVELNLPPTVVPTALGTNPTPLIYIRCRLVSGSYDSTPWLIDVAPNSVEAEQAVPASQEFPIAAAVVPVGPLPAPGDVTRVRMQVDNSGLIQSLVFDPAAMGFPDVRVIRYQKLPGVPGQLRIDMVNATVGSGWPDQQATLPGAPIQLETLRTYTLLGPDCQEWTQREDFDSSSRADRHFVVDPATGLVRFGNGERGRVPESGALVLASYRMTRAEAGNLDLEDVTRPYVTRPVDHPQNQILLGPLPMSARVQLQRITKNTGPAAGGATAETLEGAIARAVEALHAHERLLDLHEETGRDTLDQIERDRVLALTAPSRAVNLLDVERIALDVPGTRVARARAWANHHPAFGCLRAAGVVTVVILPAMEAPRPEPSEGLLAAVKRHLDRRRIVCTRLEIVGPEYVQVRVLARVQILPGTQKLGVEKRVREQIDSFFDPREGGPDHLGWPFGRSVYRSEVLDLLDSVPGVDHVLALRLETESGEPSCGDVSLCPTSLPYSGAHQIEVTTLEERAQPLSSSSARPCPPAPEAPPIS